MNRADIKPYCEGAVHVIPVPMGMTPEESWEEICMFGRLLGKPKIIEWAVFKCEGGWNCPCLGHEIADD